MVRVIHPEPERQDVARIATEHSGQRAHKLPEGQVAGVGVVHGSVDVRQELLLSAAEGCGGVSAWVAMSEGCQHDLSTVSTIGEGSHIECATAVHGMCLPWIQLACMWGSGSLTCMCQSFA